MRRELKLMYEAQNYLNFGSENKLKFIVIKTRCETFSIIKFLDEFYASLHSHFHSTHILLMLEND